MSNTEEYVEIAREGSAFARYTVSMFGFGKEKENATYAACFDIGSGSVGISIIIAGGKATVPQIIFADRVLMRVTEKDDADTRLHALKEALVDASALLSKNGLATLRVRVPHARITEMLVTVSAPWGSVANHTLRMMYDTPTKITKELFTDLTEKAKTESLEQKPENDIAFPWEITHHAITDTTINDYSIVNPIGKMGISFEIAHQTEMVAKPVRELIERVGERLFPHANLSIHTYSMALYTVARDLYPDVHTATFIDISSEATEISITQECALQLVTHVPEGANTIFRTHSKTEKVPLAHVQSEIRAYGDEVLSADARAKIAQRIDQYKKTIAEKLKSIDTSINVPNTVIITSPYEVTTFLKDAVAAAFSSISPAPSTLLDITEPLIPLVKDSVPADTFLRISALFFHKLHHGT